MILDKEFRVFYVEYWDAKLGEFITTNPAYATSAKAELASISISRKHLAKVRIIESVTIHKEWNT
jgi:hypothetical protein